LHPRHHTLDTMRGKAGKHASAKSHQPRTPCSILTRTSSTS
jgi:hypothetical protein